MAAKLIVEIRGWKYSGANLLLDVEVQAPGGATQGTTLDVAHAVVTATNFQAGVKTKVITYALNQYGLTIVADEILLR